MKLITHHFLFTATVATPIELDEHSGSALRGNLFEAVWKRFCTNKAALSCADCPLHDLCPVSALVAPLRDEHPRGRDIPRPYIILPPLDQARRYAPGEIIRFGITLFGSIIELLPYLMLSVSTLEAAGLAACRRERCGSHTNHSTRAGVLHGTGKDDGRTGDYWQKRDKDVFPNDLQAYRCRCTTPRIRYGSA